MYKGEKMKILTIGSSNVDQTYYVDKFPVNGETIRALSSCVSPGGKGLNQAVAIARSGGEVAFLSAVGQDRKGDYIKDVLQNENIEVHVKSLLNENTGTANIVVDSSGENQIIIVEGANGSTNRKFIDDNCQLIFDTEILVLQNEIEKSTNEYILELAGKREKIILVNPAPKGIINPKYYKYITYFTPNENELDFYVDNPNSCIQVKCSQLIEKGIQNVIVTLGARGVYYQNKKCNGLIPAEKVNVVDSVCAGDTFNGYFINSISAGKTIKEAIQVGVYASSIAIQRKGAMISIPFVKELVQ